MFQSESGLLMTFNPILLGVFGSFITRGGGGGHICPPPHKNGCNGWGVPELSKICISNCIYCISCISKAYFGFSDLAGRSGWICIFQKSPWKVKLEACFRS